MSCCNTTLKVYFVHSLTVAKERRNTSQGFGMWSILAAYFFYSFFPLFSFLNLYELVLLGLAIYQVIITNEARR